VKMQHSGDLLRHDGQNCKHQTHSKLCCAQVVGAPLAAGLLRLDGAAGLKGWQWLFLAEGLPTLLLGISMPFLLPANPLDIRWMSDSEAQTLNQEVIACRSSHAGTADESPLRLLKIALTNSVNFVLGSVKFAKDFTAYGCMFWAPMLIKGLLHKHRQNGDSCSAWEGPETEGEPPETGYREVLLTGIPYTFAALSSILVAWNSQVRPQPGSTAS
jgi:hypothetical protein